MSSRSHLFPTTPRSYRIGEAARQCLSARGPEGQARRQAISPVRVPRRSVGHGVAKIMGFIIREKGSFFPLGFLLPNPCFSHSFKRGLVEEIFFLQLF